MAVVTLVEGTNNAVSPRADSVNTEAGLAQSIVNAQMGLGKKGLTVAWVYDNVARTLVGTFSGTAG